MTEYDSADSSKDVLGAIIVLFWLGICCSWLYRHTTSCVLTALLESLIVFLTQEIFSKKYSLCNHAC